MRVSAGGQVLGEGGQGGRGDLSLAHHFFPGLTQGVQHRLHLGLKFGHGSKIRRNAGRFRR